MLRFISATSEGSERRSSFDRSELVCRRKSWEKNLAGTQPHARVPSPKFGETNCENPFACEHTFSRGPSALYFLHKTHAKRKNQPFPTSRMGVARGCGPHLQPRRLKKLKILTFRSGNATQICLNFIDTVWVGGLGRTFRTISNFSSFCLTEADLSLLSYHVSAHTTLNMLAGAQRYICAFFGRLSNSSHFGCSDRHENEPHSLFLNTPFLFVFPFFSG